HSCIPPFSEKQQIPAAIKESSEATTKQTPETPRRAINQRLELTWIMVIMTRMRMRMMSL
ncbi:hypothetical protein LINGRAPRIM_LOCUS680, partial [Linum grandiflorum]